MNALQRIGTTLLTATLVACVAQDETSHIGQSEAQPPLHQTNQTRQPVQTMIIPAPATPAEVKSSPPIETRIAGEIDATRTTPMAERAERADRSLQKLASGAVMNHHCCVLAPPPPPVYQYQHPTNTERYQHLEDNPVHLAAEQPVSTFSIDVDTGAYANVRRFLNDGQLPPQDAVRVEEMLNYFDYQYTPPTHRNVPFKVATELAPAPWNSNALLLKVGIKGFEVAASERPAANLVFLVDVSGSMSSADKLPLLKNAFRLLTHQLSARDKVSMVVYAGSAGVVLEPTPGNHKHKILEAIERLEAGGSTNGAAGIERAYALAHESFIRNGINRVVLATDGDFNVGTVNFETLLDMAERQRASGIALTTLGFGSGNYNDQLMEQLADAGNGNYAYIDTLPEARKVLVSELSSTLFTIAKDVKIQVEFNPATVREYRLIGYENRLLAREDFNNDKVDAGDIGAGHRVTALYEIVPVTNPGRIDLLRYGQEIATERSNELALVKLRYKQPEASHSQLLTYPILKNSAVATSSASADFRFAASVAAFGQLLRGGKYLEQFDYPQIIKLAQSGLANDEEGYRREFISLVKLAATLQGPATNPDMEIRMGRLGH